MSVDLSKTVAPKSDQMNADDLVAGPRTITITRVTGSDNAEQPVSIHWEGGDKTPWKPCKTMRRALIALWGERGDDYVGRRLTLFCDPNVKYGGVVMGGIRISHASHIDREKPILLTVKRGQRATFTVKPLSAERAEFRRGQQDSADDGDRPTQRSDIQTQAPDLSLADRVKQFCARVAAAPDITKLNAYDKAAAQLRIAVDQGAPELLVDMDDALDARRQELEAPVDDDFPGDR